MGSIGSADAAMVYLMLMHVGWLIACVNIILFPMWEWKLQSKCRAGNEKFSDSIWGC